MKFYSYFDGKTQFSHIIGLYNFFSFSGGGGGGGVVDNKSPPLSPVD